MSTVQTLRRLVLVVPTQVARWLFLALVAMGWGFDAAEQMEENTR